ncbi:MAG: 3-isopropylmalate dehydratase small subunit, partial [Spirochaetaceae bacterium]|nr:3-isopropylmalate dehydratase small subunit [Spirochaetaceae bacterium]
GNDIDTDRIIPARFLKTVTFDGIGTFAFQDVRIDEDGTATDHPFNNPVYRKASILLANKNFGCGSSREHAPQALLRWGIHAIIGESFAEIFAGNCNALGVPAVTVAQSEIAELMSLVEIHADAKISVDLVAGTVTTQNSQYRFQMPDACLHSLVGGTWDSTALLLQNTEEIRKNAAHLPYLAHFV